MLSQHAVIGSMPRVLSSSRSGAVALLALLTFLTSGCDAPAEDGPAIATPPGFQPAADGNEGDSPFGSSDGTTPAERADSQAEAPAPEADSVPNPDESAATPDVDTDPAAPDDRGPDSPDPRPEDEEPATTEPPTTPDDALPVDEEEPTEEEPTAEGPAEEEPTAEEPTAESDDTPCGTFAADIQPILDQACTSCHGADLALANLDLSAPKAYEALLTGVGSTGLPFVVAGDAAASFLMDKLSAQPSVGVTMPPPPGELSEGEITRIRDWIESGAPQGSFGACEADDAADCGECGFGLECNGLESAPGLCAGPEGQCGSVSAAGVCLSDTVVLFCSAGDESGQLLSRDCSLTAETPVCVTDTEGAAACAAQPSEVTPPSDEPAEEPVDTTPPEDEAPIEDEEPESEVTAACGTCAPGLVCAESESFPAPYCSGVEGTCGELNYAGTCLGDGILYYCSNDEGSGTPISVDCKLNAERTACGQTSEGFYDCVIPDPALELDDDEQTPVTFADVHPILEAGCSGWLCHQYNGFAQPDVQAAYAVVVEKDFADDIVEAVLDGKMPVGNFGIPLCSGDPTQDTNEKCLTQSEQDLLVTWLQWENGELPATPEEELPAGEVEIVTFDAVHPILEAGCSGFFCHNGGLANADIDVAYEKIIDKSLCDDILDEILSGSMPAGKGCTGDPVADAGKSACLNADELALIEAWVEGPVACAPPAP